MAQVWLEATYDMTFLICMLILNSYYSFFSWYDWLKMIVHCRYEVGLLDTTKPKRKVLVWTQNMLSVWGRIGCFTCIAQVWF